MKHIFVLIFVFYSFSSFSQYFEGPITSKVKVKMPDPPSNVIYDRPSVNYNNQSNTTEKLTCSDIIAFVKTNANGTTYNSYDSDAISKVTFYDLEMDYEIYYFAIVCFKNKHSYGCSEYIYRVASNSETNYASNYIVSAGQAFWDYIQPYNNILGCGM